MYFGGLKSLKAPNIGTALKGNTHREYLGSWTIRVCEGLRLINKLGLDLRAMKISAVPETNIPQYRNSKLQLKYMMVYTSCFNPYQRLGRGWGFRSDLFV